MTTTPEYTAASKELEAARLKCPQEQFAALLKIFKESEAVWLKRSEEEQARTFTNFGDQVKIFHEQRTALLKHFDAKQELHEKAVEELTLENCNLLV